MTMLTLDHVSVAKDKKSILQDANISLTQGEYVALLGPNGAGKSTLLRAMLGMQALQAGHVYLDGQNITSYDVQARARKISYLPQQPSAAWPNTVEDVVSLGRFAHGVQLGRLSEHDKQAVNKAMHACDLNALRLRRVDTLSGGELARVHCARAYAANAPILLADEPTSSLDPRHQHKVLSLLTGYVRQGHGVLVVLHDVNLALRYADRIVWIKAGQIINDMTPGEISADFVAQMYGVSAELVKSQDGKFPQILVESAL